MKFPRQIFPLLSINEANSFFHACHKVILNKNKECFSYYLIRHLQHSVKLFQEKSPEKRDFSIKKFSATWLIEWQYVKSVHIQSFFWSVFSPNVGKYRQEKTPYLDTFHIV